MSKSQSSRAQYMRGLRQRKRESQTESTKLLSELTASYKENRKRLIDALGTLKPGTSVFLQYCRAIEECDRKHREELVVRGLSPENLGANVRPGWKFVAHVSADGTVNCVEVHPGQAPPVNAKFPERSASDLEGIKALNHEFGFTDDSRFDLALPEDDPNE